MNRREFIIASSLGGGYLAFPRASAALAPAAAGLLVIIAYPMLNAVSRLISLASDSRIERKRVQFERDLERSRYLDQTSLVKLQYVRDWLALGVQSGSISYAVATDSMARSLLSLELSSDFDGQGTHVVLDKGVIRLERGGYSGRYHAAAVEYSAIGLRRHESLPIAVTSPRQLDRQEARAAIKRIEAKADNKIDGSYIHKNYAVQSVVSYSHARKPTVSGADENLYALFARKQIMQNQLNASGEIEQNAIFLAG